MAWPAGTRVDARRCEPAPRCRRPREPGPGPHHPWTCRGGAGRAMAARTDGPYGAWRVQEDRALVSETGRSGGGGAAGWTWAGDFEKRVGYVPRGDGLQLRDDRRA